MRVDRYHRRRSIDLTPAPFQGKNFEARQQVLVQSMERLEMLRKSRSRKNAANENNHTNEGAN